MERPILKPASLPCVAVGVLFEVRTGSVVSISVEPSVIGVRANVAIDALADVLIDMLTGELVGIDIGMLVGAEIIAVVVTVTIALEFAVSVS